MKLVGEDDVDEKWVKNVFENAQKNHQQKIINDQEQDAGKPFQPSTIEKSYEDDLHSILHENIPKIVPRVQLDIPSFPKEKLVRFFTEIQVLIF